MTVNHKSTRKGISNDSDFRLDALVAPGRAVSSALLVDNRPVHFHHALALDHALAAMGATAQKHDPDEIAAIVPASVVRHGVHSDVGEEIGRSSGEERVST